MEITKNDDGFVFKTTFSTLEEYADLVWAGREYKHPQVRKDQIMYWAKVEGEEQLIVMRIVPDCATTLKDRVIEHDAASGDNLGMGMAMLGMFNDDEPQEPRWEYLGDYELIDINGDLPIVKRKKQK